MVNDEVEKKVERYFRRTCSKRFKKVRKISKMRKNISILAKIIFTFSKLFDNLLQSSNPRQEPKNANEHSHIRRCLSSVYKFDASRSH